MIATCEMTNRECADCCHDCGGCMLNVVCDAANWENYCSTGSECDECGDSMERCTDWCTCKDDAMLDDVSEAQEWYDFDPDC